MKNWVRDPYAIKNVTWMPKVWYNSNSNAPADHPRNEAEINAAVAYLFANSDTYTPAVASPPRGDPKAGEQIVRSVGCLGCHIIDENDRAAVGPRRTFGQPLKSVGSKTTLRVALQLGSRSEALQPGHVHARPAAHRSRRWPTSRRI